MSTLRALELFDEISELDAELGAQRLDRLRDEDPETAALVARMLDCAAHGTTPLDIGVDPAILSKLIENGEGDAPCTGHAGVRVGAFRLERMLGRGGMGEVWLAERDDADFQQSVAVKLLHHGLERADAARRFIQERRMLAGLTHPDIARLIDGGVSESGQSWYAMEYVDGQSIVEYAHAHQLDIRARTELITRATEAVAAAQAHDIVHRDLKPSNIMVDGTGRPRLLDFGIAKWLGPTGGGEETATGLRALSPSYAAPEQVFGEPVSRATDVYALGMVMYELLVGERPSRREHHSLERMAEQVRAEQAQAPSVHARSLRAAGHRDVDAALDDIVLTCLQRDPLRRYADASVLAADLHRWLSGKPVAARGTARRMHWSRRRRVGLAAMAGGLLVASVAAWTTWSARDVQDDDAPTEAGQSANTEAATARYVAARKTMAPGDLDSLTAAEAELQALTLDQPDFMPAYALAADALTELAWYGSIDRGEALRRLRLLSGRALARNPVGLEARILAARLRFVESEFNPSHPRYLAALRESELLLQESPDDRGLLVSLANLSGILGHLEDALRHARHANRIDASDDQAFLIETRALIGLGRWDEAMLAQREALARSPRRAKTFDFITEGRAATGQFAEALATIEHCRRAGADFCDRLYTRVLRMLRAEPAPPSRAAGATAGFWDVLRSGGFDAGRRWIDAEEAKGRRVYSVYAYALLGVALSERRSRNALAVIARRSPGLIDGDQALPHETDWLLSAGVAYRQQGDAGRATEAFTRALAAVDGLSEPTLAQQAQLPDVVALAWLGREHEALQRMRRYVAAGWSHERAMTENAIGGVDPVLSVFARNEEFQHLIAQVRERNARTREQLLPGAGTETRREMGAAN